MQWVLGISVALLAYIYAGYPILIWALARARGRPAATGPYSGGVSVLMAAHNEADALPRKLKNLLELAKTEPIREIWVGLDGCTDGTAERVRDNIRISNIESSSAKAAADKYSISIVQGKPEPKSEVQGRDHQGPTTKSQQPIVQILEFKQRRGKAAVLNDLMAKAAQPFVVMMDARQRVEAGAISALLESFADPEVGVVSGALVYEAAHGAAQQGAASYWGYEKFIRACESRLWAVPGATGALYAIRKELCQPIPDNTLVDDVLIPMKSVLRGFRCLFEPSARVFDLPTADFRKENLRKRRTLAGIWQIWRLEPKIFSFFSNPIAFQWYSHKFLRLLTPFLVLAVLVSAGGIGGGGLVEGWKGGKMGGAGILFVVLMIGLAASGLAYGASRPMRSRLVGLMGAFWGVNWALLQAAWDAWTGRFEAKWK